MLNRRDVVALGLASLSGPTLGQARYPDRPIRLVVPFPPGGAFDAVARPWANMMTSLLGTVVVENIGGAGSSLGAAAVARARPDGYTLLLGGGGALVINPIAGHTPYDPVKDFDAVALVVVHAFALAVHPSLPARTLRELIDYARDNPGRLSYGSAGTGSLNHLTGELFKSLTGLPGIVHIPYRGAGPAINDLVAGQVPMVVPSMNGSVAELHRAGKLRVLAVTSPDRLIGAPDLPTAVETVPGMVSLNMVGLFVPAGTPKEIIDQIYRATRTAMSDQKLRELLVAAGFDVPVDASPERMRRSLDEEIARWTPVIKTIGLKVE
jgi:tripartite-type tricarboxylate transporter receptor subunit TctC